ncbi:MAG: MurR/RpiR family transcriptional regulator [bacterium]
METKSYNEVDILYTLMTYVDVSSYKDMYYTIAETILMNLDIIPTISISELANLCFSSPATISRFCKDLNCKNFADFKREIKVALNIAKDEIHLPPYTRQEIMADPQKLVDKIYNDTIASLLKGKQSIDIHEIDQICKLIHDAKRVHMFGYQFSRMVCNNFQLKMLKLKKFIYSFVNRGDEIQKLDTIEEGDLAIILTVSARKEINDALIAKLKEHNPKILLITCNQEYTNSLVDYYYRLKGDESTYTQSSMMGSISFMSLMDVVYVRYGLLYDQ